MTYKPRNVIYKVLPLNSSSRLKGMIRHLATFGFPMSKNEVVSIFHVKLHGHN